MQNLQSCQPKFDTKTVIAPVFYPEDGTVDHDFDIGLLSEYLFEEERDGRMKCIDGLKEENSKDSDDDDDADGLIYANFYQFYQQIKSPILFPQILALTMTTVKKLQMGSVANHLMGK